MIGRHITNAYPKTHNIQKFSPYKTKQMKNIRCLLKARLGKENPIENIYVAK